MATQYAPSLFISTHAFKHYNTDRWGVYIRIDGSTVDYITVEAADRESAVAQASEIFVKHVQHSLAEFSIAAAVAS